MKFKNKNFDNNAGILDFGIKDPITLVFISLQVLSINL